jgi:hypothetical protein
MFYLGMGWTPIYESMTTKQAQEEIEAIRKAGARIRRTKASARAFMIKHGFITKSGKLTKRYR